MVHFLLTLKRIPTRQRTTGLFIYLFTFEVSKFILNADFHRESLRKWVGESHLGNV